jgi:glycine/D-amino acid oxidase-like deaminating enzyme
VEDAMKAAANYQLVTPVSGAVVLETQAQYAQAGLQPVSADSVPVIPEPSGGLLFLIGIGMFGWKRFRKRNCQWDAPGA